GAAAAVVVAAAAAAAGKQPTPTSHAHAHAEPNIQTSSDRPDAHRSGGFQFRLLFFKEPRRIQP
ncbi:MAG: hypothetical protein AAGD00_07700, partial [Planctomycetota bacterium]